MTTILIIAGVLILLYALALLITAAYFFRIALVRFDRKKAEAKKGAPLIQIPSGGADPCPDYWENSKAWYGAQSWQPLSIKSDDGLTLKGALLVNGSTDKTAVVVHGWTGCKEETGTLARLYYELGFSVLAPDLRAHGESEGRYFTFGYKDKKDIVLWAQKAVELGAKQIILAGHSMGGATVMMAAGEKLPEQVKCIVEDCGYTSAYDQFYHTLGILLPRPLRFMRRGILFFADVINRAVQGFSLRGADSVAALAKASVPVLFIHGDMDEFVPYQMQEKVFDACASDKERLTVHGAGHCKSIAMEPALYRQAVRAFAFKYID